jgi:catecholate siderophore receptor
VNLEPEENRTYEAGAKLSLLEGVLDLRGAIFRIEKTNARTTDPANASVQVLEGEQHVDGFELEAVGNITKQWQVLAGYAFLDSEIDSSRNPAEVGKRLASTPRHAANLWTSYDFGHGFRAGTGLFYVGKRYANNTNTNKVSDYVRWDASLGYEVGRFEFQLNAFNITNEKYFEGVYPAHAAPGAGRTLLLTSAVKF